MIDLDMMHIEETPDAEKRQTLNRALIADIVKFRGPVTEITRRFNITRAQYEYCVENYNEEGRLMYRRNLDVTSYS